MRTVYWIILVPMVYLAYGVFFFGNILKLYRIFSLPKHPSTLAIYPKKRGALWRSIYDTLFMPTVRRHAPVFWVFLMIFHVGVILLIIGHMELIKEFKVIQIIPHKVFLGNGFVGLSVTISILFFLMRRFKSPYRELSVPEDYYLLILLFIICFLGSELHWARSWYGYSELGVEEYREYLFSLITFKPKVPEIVYESGHSFVLVLHVLFANLFLIIFPFSKIIHSFFAFAVNKLRRG